MIEGSTRRSSYAASLVDRLHRLLSHSSFAPFVIAVGLVIRAIVATVFPVEPFSDFAWYLARATELANGQGYMDAGVPTAYWPVGWPAILAVGLMVAGSTQFAVLGLNLVGALVIMLMTILIGRRIVGSNVVANGALFIYALYPNHIAYTGIAATEIVYTAVVMGAFATVVIKRDSFFSTLVGGALFGIATLMKPQTLAFPFGVWIAVGLIYPEIRWKKWCRGMVCIYIGILAAVLPWSMRNLSVFGEFVLVSTNGGAALFLGANDEAKGGHYEYEHTVSFDRLGIPLAERVERQVELDKKQKQVASQWIKDNLPTYISWMPKKAWLLWYKDTDGFWSFDHSYPNRIEVIRALQWTNQLFFVAIIILSVPCLVTGVRALVVRSQRSMCLGLLFCMPAFVTLLAAVFTGQIRYHFPAMPFLILAASWTVVTLSTLERRSGVSVRF